MASFRIAVIGAALVVCPVLVAQQAEPRRIATAPAFNARALTSNPTKDWITNGGNVFNQRYSPLTLLDRTNVKDLRRCGARVWARAPPRTTRVKRTLIRGRSVSSGRRR